MSSYESYDRRAADYDRTRGPVGLEIIVGCLAQGAAPLHRMTVLDAGCGTGNYARALLAHVARIEAVDRSAGMLAAARAKLKDAIAAGRVVLHEAGIDALPLDDGAVDGVMINQVLHHLADDPVAGWPAHRHLLAELARVLRPGGVLVINVCSHAQIEQSFWPYHLIPQARGEILRRLIPLDTLETMLRANGLAPCGRFAPIDALMQGHEHLDPRGPLRAEWRAGDSIWALVDEEQLAAVERTLRELDRHGRLGAYVAEHDAMRAQIGQVTFLYVLKAAFPPSGATEL